MKNKKTFFILTLIVFFLSLSTTITLYLVSYNSGLNYEIINCEVLDVEEKYINYFNHSGGRFELIIKVKYDDSIYELLNDYNETYLYSEGSVIKAYLSNGKLYANKEGVKKGTIIYKAYFIFLFLTLALIPLFCFSLINYKKLKKQDLIKSNSSKLLEEESYNFTDMNNFDELNKLAIEVAINLSYLYNQLKKLQNKNIYLILRIKDINASKTSRVDNVEEFVQKISEKNTISGYELSVSYVDVIDVDEEYNNKNKIAVKIEKDAPIDVDFQYEILDGLFDAYLENISKMIEKKYKKIVNLNIVRREKSIREFINFGILGEYDLKKIVYKTENKISIEKIEEEKRNVINDFEKNLNNINKKILYEMYYHLSTTDYDIWESKSFEKIINNEMLPNDFYNMSNEEKRNVLYGFKKKCSYSEFYYKIENEKVIWNLDNFKEDINIVNIIIDADRGNIIIEFNGICDFFNAYIRIDYKNNYEIKEFNPS